MHRWRRLMLPVRLWQESLFAGSCVLWLQRRAESRSAQGLPHLTEVQSTMSGIQSTWDLDHLSEVELRLGWQSLGWVKGGQRERRGKGRYEESDDDGPVSRHRLPTGASTSTDAVAAHGPIGNGLFRTGFEICSSTNPFLVESDDDPHAQEASQDGEMVIIRPNRRTYPP